MLALEDREHTQEDGPAVLSGGVLDLEMNW